MLRGHPRRGFFGGGGKRPEVEKFDPEYDYYKDMGLTSKATDAEIKNQYYKLCYEYHPDRSSGMHQDKFKLVNAAYQILKDKELRKQYDEARAIAKDGGRSYYDAHKQ